MKTATCYPSESGSCWVCGNNGDEPCQCPEMPNDFRQIAIMLAQAGYANPNRAETMAMLEKQGASTRLKNLADYCFSEVRKAFDKLQREMGQQTLF